MGSPQFAAMDRALRRLHWQTLIDQQLEATSARPFRASLVVNARTGRPIQSEIAACQLAAAGAR